MNIDTLNAYCRSVPVTDLPLSQGRLKLDSSVYLRRLHWLVQHLHVGQFKVAPCAQMYYTKKLQVEVWQQASAGFAVLLCTHSGHGVWDSD